MGADNLIGAIKSGIKQAGAEVFIVVEKHNNPKLANARFKKCIGCPGKRYDQTTGDCLTCGCNVIMKSKSLTSINYKRLSKETTHCPWGYFPVIMEDGTIGGNDRHIANEYRAKYGKPLLPDVKREHVF